MSSSRYIFHRDSATKYWTAVHIVAIVVIAILLSTHYVGGFFLAWFASFVVALLLLMVLSVPRDIEVGDEKMTINCLLDTTEIEIENIVSVRKVSPREIRWVLPIFGGCGFLGYYGHFFDFKHFRSVVIYATEWRYMVEIVDVNEDYYYVSCRRRDALIEELNIK